MGEKHLGWAIKTIDKKLNRGKITDGTHQTLRVTVKASL